MPLSSKFDISLMHENDYDQVLSLLTNSFFHDEPIAQCLQVTETLEFSKNVIHNCLHDKCSCVAYDTETNQIVAICLNEIIYKNNKEEINESDEKIRFILELFMNMQKNLNIFDQLNGYRAPRLRFLQINQNESLSLQISIFQYTSKSVRVLDLRNCNYSFNEEECMKLCHSPLGIQCKILSINVKNRESINIFVKYMTNLRALHITCEDEMFNKRSTSEENANDEFCDENIDNSDELIRWLEDHLPSTCLVGRDPHSHSFIRIWL
ncbi:unnamed protein product [Rotaria sp. Silwood1]|nr:unnamed protein product [Rotaria sp. Silwood1]CAF4890378.1 unnamed protein product [Rotaria sp. Silwood1]